MARLDRRKTSGTNAKADKTAENYDAIAELYLRNVHSHRLDCRFIDRFLSKLKPNQRILDIGSGPGTLFHELQSKRKLQVVGIDLSERMVELARAHHPSVEVHQMDLRRLAFPPRHFDAAIASYSLIHTPKGQRASALRRISIILKPGGHLYLALQEHPGSGRAERHVSPSYSPKVSFPIHLAEEGEVRRSLDRAGFRVLWVDRREPKRGELPFNKLHIAAQKERESLPKTRG